MATKSKQVFSTDHGSIKGMQVAMSTPAFIPLSVHRGVETPKVAPPKAPPHSGSNAQTEQMERTMAKTRKVQKVIGIGVGY